MIKVRPGIVLMKENKVLLMQYVYGGNEVYALPGGNVEGTETLETTLVREAEEELGIQVEVGALLLVGETFHAEKNRLVLHCIFWGTIREGQPALNPQHTTAAGLSWVPVNELSRINMYPDVREPLKPLLSLAVPPSGTYLGRIAQQWF